MRTRFRLLCPSCYSEGESNERDFSRAPELLQPAPLFPSTVAVRITLPKGEYAVASLVHSKRSLHRFLFSIVQHNALYFALIGCAALRHLDVLQVEANQWIGE